MLTLDKDLQTKKTSLKEFENITVRVLQYLPNVLTGSERKGSYSIFNSDIANSKKFLRPINTELFINDPALFKNKVGDLIPIIGKIREGSVEFTASEMNIIDSVLYTIQQSIGVGLDLMVNPSGARKHVGNRFEELMKVFFY